ncbi:MAG: hypothetical protein VB140_09730, partial [Burkholderia sp.]
LHSRRRHQPVWWTSLVRNPFVSPEIIPSMLLHPHTRFMQQRPAAIITFHKLPAEVNIIYG